MVDSTKKIEAFTKRLRTRLIAVIMLAVMCAGSENPSARTCIFLKPWTSAAAYAF